MTLIFSWVFQLLVIFFSLYFFSDFCASSLANDMNKVDIVEAASEKAWEAAVKKEKATENVQEKYREYCNSSFMKAEIGVFLGSAAFL